MRAQIRIVSTVQRAVLFAVFATVAGVLFAAPNASAQVVPVEPAPTVVLPAVCSAVAPVVPVVPAEPEVGEGEIEPGEPVDPAEPSEPAEPTATAPSIAFTATTPTNNPLLSWTFTTTVPAADPAILVTGYGYAVYSGDVQLTNGLLSADATVVAYTASAVGTYKVYVWALQQGSDDPTACANATTEFNNTPPVIEGDKLILDGNVATPNLSTPQQNLQYAWAITAGPKGGVAMSDPAVLTPAFTFTVDGTYEFTLVVTDIFGNTTTLVLGIVYAAPFVPGPTSPIIPDTETPKPVIAYVRPPSTAVAVAPSVAQAEAEVTEEVIAQILSEAENENNTDATSETKILGAASASDQGWKLFGLAWYWWLLIIAIIVSGWLWTVRTYRVGNLPDDL